MRYFVISLLYLSVNCSVAFSQFTDRYWCFGDSAGINFANLNNPIPGHSILRSRGTCASICDSAGNLLFYASDPHVSLWFIPGNYNLGYVVGRNHQFMQNGDSLVCQTGYQEMLIVPDPANYSRFYLFTAGVLNPASGFFYNVIDLSYNGGLGKVTQKNVQLQPFEVSDGLAAVKHGNGRDWWVVMKPYSNTNTLDEFYFYLVSPSGISGPFVQHIGSPVQYGGFLRLKFSANGQKLFAMTPGNLFESYDFDRCSGLLTNVNTVHASDVNPPYKNYWSFALSPNTTRLYTTSNYLGVNQDSSYLCQYDLNSANILGSADTLFRMQMPDLAGLLQTGPDGKIYFASASWVADCDFDYLYCDTTWTIVNSNLSVINTPDSLGLACGFQPYSFNLGAHRTYIGLPNNPNYELKADSGSSCDTLHVGLQEFGSTMGSLLVFYDSPWQKAFINAKKLDGRNYKLSVFDIAGREVFHESGKLDSKFYTRDLDMYGFESGLYVVSLTTDKEKLVKKFVKN